MVTSYSCLVDSSDFFFRDYYEQRYYLIGDIDSYDELIER